jgi:tetratricopeptide (TPR) repeat protein
VLRLRSYDDAWGNVAEHAAAALAAGHSAWIPSIEALDAPVVAQLVARAPSAIVVEALGPGEVDAPTHLLVQLMRGFDLDLDRPWRADSDDTAIEGTAGVAETIARRAKHDGRALVLVLPDTWPRDGWLGRALDDGPGPRVTWRHLQAIISALSTSGLRVVVVSGSDADHPWRTSTRCLYRRAEVGAADLEASNATTAAAVETARAALDETGRTVTVADARALVGLAGLGEELEELSTAPGALVRRLVGALEKAGHADTLRVLACWRQGALGKRAAQVVEGIPDATAAVLLSGDGAGRPSAAIRRALRDHLRRDGATGADLSAHARLADAHRQLDGAASPSALSPGATVAWLEKVHHLANAGPAADAEWRQQAIVSREQYWDRARHLSRVQRRFGEAAELYRDCLARFGSDSYTHHYLAFNLHGARASLSDVRTHYQAAVALWQDNPWWNSRLVTFLIGHGTLREAKEAFAAAVAHIDPDGERMSATPWLALHLHRWVVRRWLALGYIAEARDVLNQIPDLWREQEQELRRLDQMVRDAEEALELGESVYPSGTPVENRWCPRVTPDTNGRDSARRRWWPGRVVASHADGVDIVAADPQTRMAYRATIVAAEWRKMADQAPDEARGYVELAEYDDGARLVRAVPTPPVESLADEEADIIARLQA